MAIRRSSARAFRPRRPRERVDLIAKARRSAEEFDPNAYRPAQLRRLHLRAVPAKPIPAFAEEVNFSVPQELITGVKDVDALYITVTHCYEAVAQMRQEVHARHGLGYKDAVSFSRQTAMILKSIQRTRNAASELCTIITSLGYAPQPEPRWFSRPVIV